jgi:hypothetical protein
MERGEIMRKIPVIQWDKSKQPKATFPSMRDAEKGTGVFTQSISECVRGKRKTAGGFYWTKA